MLELIGGSIRETLTANNAIQDAHAAIQSAYATNQAGMQYMGSLTNDGSYLTGGLWNGCSPYQTVWQSYPVYICTDKTKKAIDILKQLQDDKVLEVRSVNKFIDLVEKIANLL